MIVTPQCLPPTTLALIDQFRDELSKHPHISLEINIHYSPEHVYADDGKKLDMLIQILENLYQDNDTGLRLRSGNRDRTHSDLRKIYSKIAFEMGYTYGAITKKISPLSRHTFALYQCNEATRLLGSDAVFKAKFIACINLLYNNPEFKNERVIQSYITA